MKAILRVKYDCRHGDKDLVFCFDNVNDEIIYRLLNELDKQFGYSPSYKSIEFYPSSDKEGEFRIRQQLFYEMTQHAITSNKLRCYYDDVLFHDKVKLFTTDNSVKELIWLIGDDYTRLLGIRQLNFFYHEVKYMMKDNVILYLINLEEGTIDELVKSEVC